MEFILSLVFGLILILALYIPYIIFMGIFAMIIWTIATKKIASKTLKCLIILVILLYGTIIIGSFKTETPDNLYTKIKRNMRTLLEIYVKNHIGDFLILTNIMNFTFLLIRMVK